MVAEGERSHFFGSREHCRMRVVGIRRKLGAGHVHERATLRRICCYSLHKTTLLLRRTAIGRSQPHHMGGMGIVAELLAALSNVAPGRRHVLNIKSRRRICHLACALDFFTRHPLLPSPNPPPPPPPLLGQTRACPYDGGKRRAATGFDERAREVRGRGSEGR